MTQENINSASVRGAWGSCSGGGVGEVVGAGAAGVLHGGFRADAEDGGWGRGATSYAPDATHLALLKILRIAVVRIPVFVGRPWTGRVLRPRHPVTS
jgi:hypothetical protein